MTQETRKQHNSRASDRPGASRTARLTALFFKQVLAALLCGAVVFSLHSAKVPFADSLGRALRYESDLTKLYEAGETIASWLNQRLPFLQRSNPAEIPAQESDTDAEPPVL